MEEKERKQLKKRLLGLVINEPPYPYPITMAEVMVNDMSKPNLKPLLNFIEKELDKAREEGERAMLDEIWEASFNHQIVGEDLYCEIKISEAFLRAYNLKSKLKN